MNPSSFARRVAIPAILAALLLAAPAYAAKTAVSTFVTCPQTATIGVQITCSALVQEDSTGQAFTGSVTWTSTGGGTFTANAQCPVGATSSGSTRTASCSIGYTPVAAGSDSITAHLAGDATHDESTDTLTGVSVIRRPTQTSATCAPPTIVLGGSATCTITVADPGMTPTGEVGLSSNSLGTVLDCTLIGGTCSVQVRSFTSGDAANTIMVTYVGDAQHTGSTGSTVLHVLPHSTMLALACKNPTVETGLPTACTATVTDTDLPGAQGLPVGSVTFTGGGVSVSSCVLSYATASSAKCFVEVAPTVLGPNHVTASYAGAPGYGAALPATALITVKDPARVGAAAVAAQNVLLACAAEPVRIVDVQRSGKQVLVSGLTVQPLEVRVVRILSAGKLVGTGEVGSDGTFAVAASPSSSPYVAEISGLQTKPVSLSTRLTLSVGRSVNHLVRITGHITTGHGRRVVTARQQLGCSQSGAAGSTRTDPKGTFKLTVPTPSEPVVYRIITPAGSQLVVVRV